MVLMEDLSEAEQGQYLGGCLAGVLNGRCRHYSSLPYLSGKLRIAVNSLAPGRFQFNFRKAFLS